MGSKMILVCPGELQRIDLFLRSLHLGPYLTNYQHGYINFWERMLDLGFLSETA
jgi:hypothetical protein